MDELNDYAYKIDEHIYLFLNRVETEYDIPWQLIYGYLMKTQYTQLIKFDERDIIYVFNMLLSKIGNIEIDGDICTISLVGIDKQGIDYQAFSETIEYIFSLLNYKTIRINKDNSDKLSYKLISNQLGKEISKCDINKMYVEN